MIESLSSVTTLYHGSYCEVQTPKLELCKKFKDFGQGFYLTTNIEQARQFAILTTRKAFDSGIINEIKWNGVVSCFTYEPHPSDKIKIYESANSDWLHCVVAHRRKNTFDSVVVDLSQYDIIGGKVANDATNATILAYMSGLYGPIGTTQADAICIGLLLPERLENQFCFRSNQSIGHLNFKESFQL